jgi:Protein of unknown function (DUF1360)
MTASTTRTRPLSSVRTRLAGLARSQQRQYAGDADRPLGGYLGTMTAYGAVAGGLAAATALTGRQVPDGLPAKDVALCALATHKLSRLLTKDPVTSPLRAKALRTGR